MVDGIDDEATFTIGSRSYTLAKKYFGIWKRYWHHGSKLTTMRKLAAEVREENEERLMAAAELAAEVREENEERLMAAAECRPVPPELQLEMLEAALHIQEGVTKDYGKLFGTSHDWCCLAREHECRLQGMIQFVLENNPMLSRKPIIEESRWRRCKTAFTDEVRRRWTDFQETMRDFWNTDGVLPVVIPIRKYMRNMKIRENTLLDHFRLTKKFLLLKAYDVKILHDFFNMLDCHQYEGLNGVQVKYLLRYFTNMNNSRIKRTFQMCTHPNCALDFDDFYALACILLVNKEGKNVSFIIQHTKIAFQRMDIDHSGSISIAELMDGSFLFNLPKKSLRNVCHDFAVTTDKVFDIRAFRSLILVIVAQQRRSIAERFELQLAAIKEEQKR